MQERKKHYNLKILIKPIDIEDSDNYSDSSNFDDFDDSDNSNDYMNTKILDKSKKNIFKQDWKGCGELL